MLATRSSTGASVENAWKRASAGPPSRTVSERQCVPAISTVEKPSPVRRGGHGVGHVAVLRDDLVADRDLHERAGALQQRLAPARAAAEAALAAGGPRSTSAVCSRSSSSIALRPSRSTAASSSGPAISPPMSDRQQRRERQPRAQAAGQPHGRSAQPTPRTVCSVLGSPPASSLRRT